MQFAKAIDAFSVAAFGTIVVFILLFILSIYVRIQSFVLNSISNSSKQKVSNQNSSSIYSKKGDERQIETKTDLSKSSNYKKKGNPDNKGYNSGFSQSKSVEDYAFKINDKNYFVKIQRIKD